MQPHLNLLLDVVRQPQVLDDSIPEPSCLDKFLLAFSNGLSRATMSWVLSGTRGSRGHLTNHFIYLETLIEKYGSE
jgi:hypothetical protein